MSQPIFRITADGDDITGEIAKRLLYIRVLLSRTFSNDKFEIQMDNRAPYIDLPTKGTNFDVSMGYRINNEDKLFNVGKFESDEAVVWGIPHTITIIGHAVSTASNIKTTQNASYHGQTVSSIVSTIAGRNGLGAILDPSFGSIKLDHVEQKNQSDMDFLTDLARNNNGILHFANGSVYFAKQDGGPVNPVEGVLIPMGTTQLPLVSRGEAGGRYEYQTTGRGEYQGVKARYWDAKEAKEKFAGVGDTDKVTHTLGEMFSSADAAGKAAQSTFTSLGQSTDTFNSQVPGNCAIAPDVPITLQDFPPQVPVLWNTDRAEHIMTGKGAFQTMFACIMPGAGAGTGGAPAPDAKPDQEEKQENQDSTDDGHTITESADGSVST